MQLGQLAPHLPTLPVSTYSRRPFARTHSTTAAACLRLSRRAGLIKLGCAGQRRVARALPPQSNPIQSNPIQSNPIQSNP